MDKYKSTEAYDFNTSYVVIKPTGIPFIICPYADFNTSYVVIKREGLARTYMLNIFQYILCCY